MGDFFAKYWLEIVSTIISLMAAGTVGYFVVRFKKGDAAIKQEAFDKHLTPFKTQIENKIDDLSELIKKG